jgi:hypothetical protein
MRQRLDWRATESVPEREEILRLQGIDPDVAVPARIAALVDEAVAMYVALAQPRAIVADIPAAEFADVYHGDGRNAPETPLAVIYPRARHLAMMVATVGPRVSGSIHDLFERHDVALGCMLDAVASAAADRLADLAAERYLATLAGAGDLRVLVYSPGYCGWHITGQRALFRWLQPDAVGVELNMSCLMQPLKSVSGVLVAGPGDIHKFRPTYDFCDDCQDKHCRGRMASVLRS